MLISPFLMDGFLATYLGIEGISLSLMHDQMAAHHVGAQQTQNICITFVQRRHHVFDVGPTLYKCYTNDLCLLRGGA